MIVASLLALAIVLVAAGAGITAFIARSVPLDVLDQAQRHGRFAHLGQPEFKSGPARAVRATAPAGAHAGGLRTA